MKITTPFTKVGSFFKDLSTSEFAAFHAGRLAITTFVSSFTALSFMVYLYSYEVREDSPCYKQLECWLELGVPLGASLLFSNYLSNFLKEKNTYTSLTSKVAASAYKATRFMVSGISGVAGMYKIFNSQPTPPTRDDISYSNWSIDVAMAIFSLGFAYIVYREHQKLPPDTKILLSFKKIDAAFVKYASNHNEQDLINELHHELNNLLDNKVFMDTLKNSMAENPQSFTAFSDMVKTINEIKIKMSVNSLNCEKKFDATVLQKSFERFTLPLKPDRGETSSLLGPKR